MKGYTRAKPIKTVQYLSAQSKHARREDKTSELRMRGDVAPGTSLSWTFDDGPKPEFKRRTAADEKQPDYLSSFKSFKKANGVGERKGAQLGIHLLVGVSPEWIQETGNLHDPENPRNKQLLKAAVDWANTWSQGVYAARLDLDETGGAVVDLFVAPVRDQLHKNGSSKSVVSVNKALEELSQAVFGKRSKHYAALNSSWAEYAAQHLDLRIERGFSKDKSGKEHIPPDEYRELMQEANNALEAARNKEAQADERLRQIDAEVAERVQVAVESKVKRVADLAVRVIAGVADGSTKRNTHDQTWMVNLKEDEINELKPFWSKVSPALVAVEKMVERAGRLLGKLSGLFKKQGEEAIEAEAQEAGFSALLNHLEKAPVTKAHDQDQEPAPGLDL